MSMRYFIKQHVICAVLLAFLIASPVSAQDLGAVVASLHEERANYGATMSDEQCVELINAVAWKHRADGWGLSGKDFGTHGVRYDGARVAHDILHHRPTNKIWDVLGSAGAASTPPSSLGPGGPPPGSNRPWVAPIVPEGVTPAPTPTPQPQPTPTPTPVDLSAVLAKLDAVLAEIATLRANSDGIANVATQARDFAEDAKTNASDVKHVEIPRVLEALKQQQQAQCMVGRIKGAFGGSYEARFCPAP
jgi:hypothetical protein